MNRKVIVGVCASSLFLLAGSSMADGREDYYTQLNQQQYFNMPENARTVGMAGSSVVTSADSSSTIGNPAGLGFMKDADVSVTYFRDQISGNDSSTFEDIMQETDAGHVLAALPIVPTLDGTPRYGTLGIGWSGGRGDADDVLDTESRNWGLHLAYGKDLSDRLALGYSLGYLHKKFTLDSPGDDIVFGTKMNDGVVHTVGTQYKASNKTTLGLDTFYGMGSYDDQVVESENVQTASEDVDSWGIRGGLGHTMGATLLASSIDYTMYNSDTDDDSTGWGFRTGVEQTINDWFKARVGARYQANLGYKLASSDVENENAKYFGFSAGAGFRLMKNLLADYGVEYRHVGDGSDWLHSVTLSVPFSLCVD